jgi:hypothetical protein
MATTTFRRDVTTRLVALAEDFKNANPTLLLRVYHRRPTGFTPDLPAMYVGSKNEAIVHTSGLRQRTMEPQLVLVGNPTGAPDEIADEVDTLVDYFLDYITVHPHAISSNTVTQVTTIRDVELEVDDVVYPAAVLTLGDTIALEGRSRSGA